MLFRLLFLILMALDIPMSSYNIGKLKKGESIQRSRLFFITSIIGDLIVIPLIYFYWDA